MFCFAVDLLRSSGLNIPSTQVVQRLVVIAQEWEQSWRTSRVELLAEHLPEKGSTDTARQYCSTK